MRDIVLEETIYLDFTTRAFGTGVPGTLGGTPVLSVMEENNITPITAGVSLSVDRASVAGFNMATIAATAANGYESGKGYSVYISTGTVGGTTVVGEIVAEFTIESSAAAQDLANGTDGLTALKTGIDAIPTTAMRGTDNAALASVCTEVRLQALTDWLNGGRLDLLLDAIPTTAMRGTDSAALASVCTETRLQALTDWLNGGRLDLLLDAIPTTAMRGTDGANTVVPDAAGVAPTAIEIRQEMDTNSVDLNTLVAGQTTINNNVLSNSTDIAAIPTTPMRGTDGANTVVPDAAGTAPTLSEILTTAMTEDYAADGVAGSISQVLFLLQSMIGDFSIAGTTITAKKLDGSTTAATYTLDDGTNPTSRTRTT